MSLTPPSRRVLLSPSIQYFVKTPDAEVESLLKLLTLLSWSEISETMKAHEVEFRFEPMSAFV
jgi:hypothetical protein